MTSRQAMTAIFAAVALGILGGASVAQAGNQGDIRRGLLIL
jgi:hypothetical protein